MVFKLCPLFWRISGPQHLNNVLIMFNDMQCHKNFHERLIWNFRDGNREHLQRLGVHAIVSNGTYHSSVRRGEVSRPHLSPWLMNRWGRSIGSVHIFGDGLGTFGPPPDEKKKKDEKGKKKKEKEGKRKPKVKTLGPNAWTLVKTKEQVFR